VPQRRRRKRLGAATTPNPPTADAPNVVWAVDLQFDATTDGRPIKIVSIVDEHTRECLGGLVDRNITGRHLIDELDRLAVDRGYPAVLRCDNGPELACAAMADWAGEHTGLHFIPPAWLLTRSLCRAAVHHRSAISRPVRALRQVLAGYGFAVFELAGRDEAQVCVQGPSAPVLRVVARGFAMPRQSGPFQQLKNCGAAVSASLMATVDDQSTDPIAAIGRVDTPHHETDDFIGDPHRDRAPWAFVVGTQRQVVRHGPHKGPLRLLDL
jgi:hypothetical protein